jgi:hypothetical protein
MPGEKIASLRVRPMAGDSASGAGLGGNAGAKGETACSCPGSSPQRRRQRDSKYRDLLEDFELLQNLEKIKYLDFFTEKKEAKGKEKSGAKPAGKENARKDSNATPKPR